MATESCTGLVTTCESGSERPIACTAVGPFVAAGFGLGTFGGRSDPGNRVHEHRKATACLSSQEGNGKWWSCNLLEDEPRHMTYLWQQFAMKIILGLRISGRDTALRTLASKLIPKLISAFLSKGSLLTTMWELCHKSLIEEILPCSETREVVIVKVLWLR